MKFSKPLVVFLAVTALAGCKTKQKQAATETSYVIDQVEAVKSVNGATKDDLGLPNLRHFTMKGA